jgi:hypothetical protein
LIATVALPPSLDAKEKGRLDLGWLLLFVGVPSQWAEWIPIPSITSHGELLLSFDLLDHERGRSSPFKHLSTSRNLLSGER